MTLDELKAKIDSGATLTQDEQKELFAMASADFEKLKQEDPQKYLVLTEEITKIVAELNKEIHEASQN